MVGKRARINAPQRAAVINLLAIDQLLRNMEITMRQLAGRCAGGWRDYRLVQSKISHLADDINDTIPVDQLQQLKRQGAMSEIRIMSRSVQPLKDEYLISDEDLAVLLSYAVENTCIMCDGKDTYSCQLRKLIKELPVEATDGRAEIMSPCLRDM